MMRLRGIPSALLACSMAFCVPTALPAQEGEVSFAELARRARQRKRAASEPAAVIERLDDATICRGDWDCFLAALEARQRVRLTIPDTVDVSEPYGAVIISEVHLEIYDCGEETCRLTGRTENTTVRITDGMRARLLLNGWTAQQINERERAAQARVRTQDEASVHCVFQIDRLRYFLEQRKLGNTSEKDWELADRCEGLDQTVTDPFAPPAP